MNTLCPICEGLHRDEETQAFELLGCAQKLTKRAKNQKGFRREFETFINYLDSNNYMAIEARAYLIEFEHTLSSTADIQRSYFSSEKVLVEAAKMRERILGKRAKKGEIRRPKQMCPVCFKFHFYSAEIPDKCWNRVMKGDYSLAIEFNKFLQDNNYGELTLEGEK